MWTSYTYETHSKWATCHNSSYRKNKEWIEVFPYDYVKTETMRTLGPPTTPAPWWDNFGIEQNGVYRKHEDDQQDGNTGWSLVPYGLQFKQHWQNFDHRSYSITWNIAKVPPLAHLTVAIYYKQGITNFQEAIIYA